MGAGPLAGLEAAYVREGSEKVRVTVGRPVAAGLSRSRGWRAAVSCDRTSASAASYGWGLRGLGGLTEEREREEEEAASEEEQGRR